MRLSPHMVTAIFLAGCTGSSEPIEPGSLVDISGGVVYTCGIDDVGAMSCWGMAMEPDLGTPEAPYPDAVFTQIDADAHNTCGVLEDGSGMCWGGHFDGIDDIPSATDLESISMGRYHACGLHSDGELSCWGTDAPVPAGPFAQVSAGSLMTCAVTVTGEVTCWGEVFDTFVENIPTGDIVSVDASGIPCALDASGEVTCWDYTYDDLGLLKDHSVVAMETGASMVCGLTAEGAVVCDGEDEYGQSAPPKNSFTTFGLGYDHGCGVADGETICWGNDSNEQSTP